MKDRLPLTILVMAFCVNIALAEDNPTTRSADVSDQQNPQSPTRGASPGRPATYSQVRWDEDYSYLKDPKKRTDWLDPIKYIPLNSTGDIWLSFGGQLRERYEYFNDLNFGRARDDHNGYGLFRFTPYADLHVTPYWRLFAQFRTDDTTGRLSGPRGRDTDSADLQQGFVEFDLPQVGDIPDSRFSLRAGRQHIVLGRERLIGISDFSNANRNFDAVRATFTTGKNQLDAFWLTPVNVEKYDFDSDNSGDSNLFGLYDTLTVLGTLKQPTLKVSGYFFALYNNGTNAFRNAPAGDEARYTAGTEITGKIGDFDYDAENAYQFGRYDGEIINAFSTAEEIGYTFKDVQTQPRPFIGIDMATGDHDPNNGHLGTFNQLFPSGHTYFGYIDYIGRQNIIDLHPGVEATLLKDHQYAQKVALRGEYHQFWRESTHDAVYNTSGAVIVGAGDSSARSIGSEVDLLLNWQIDRHLASYVGYSHFWSDSFIQQTGRSRDTDFAYVALAYTF